ncbi:four-carbon acid sugar kinase family protein [Microbacterium tumbae]
MRRSAADLLVIADDLSGAAESASAIATAIPQGGGVPVRLLSDGPYREEMPVGSPVVIDTNSRSAPAGTFPARMRTVDPLLPERSVIVKKIDSLLRGDFAAEIEWMLRLGRPVVVSPALPAARRIVLDGRVLADGLPLERTPAWTIESARPPASLSESFSTTVAHVPLSVVRGPGTELGRAITASGGIVVCDAEQEADLRRIAAAALAVDPAPVLVGASALVAAVAGLLAPGIASDSGENGSAIPRPHAARAAFIVGSAEPSARRQVDRLADAGANILRLSPAELTDGATAAHRASAAAALRHPVSAITFDSRAPFDPSQRGSLSRALASVLTDAPSRTADTAFLLTGGQTARSILDAWGVRSLVVHGDIDAGTAFGITDGGVPVATRPGSFGDDDSLLRIAHELIREPTPA